MYYKDIKQRTKNRLIGTLTVIGIIVLALALTRLPGKWLGARSDVPPGFGACYIDEKECVMASSEQDCNDQFSKTTDKTPDYPYWVPDSECLLDAVYADTFSFSIGDNASAAEASESCFEHLLNTRIDPKFLARHCQQGGGFEIVHPPKVLNTEFRPDEFVPAYTVHCGVVLRCAYPAPALKPTQSQPPATIAPQTSP